MEDYGPAHRSIQLQYGLDDEPIGTGLEIMQFHRCDALCERHAYPESLRTILNVVLALAGEILGERTSIVLSPSISTGDFVWKEESGVITLLSDIDGFVFTDADKVRRERFQAEILNASRGLGGPHFKIDLSISSPSALERLPRTFQMVETRLGGFELAGDGVLSRFPREFDPRHSRQAFLTNLWKPLEFLDEGVWEQAAARLLLDIPLLATSELGICRPGHRARAEWFLEEHPGDLGRSTTLRQAVATAYSTRRRHAAGDPLRDLLVPAIAETIAALDGAGPPQRRPGAQLVERFSSWLPPRTGRRMLGELAAVVRRPRHPLADLRWWTSRKEALGGAALWGLLQIVYSQEQPNVETAQCLGAYSGHDAIDVSRVDFVSRARDQYRSGFTELYPSRA